MLNLRSTLRYMSHLAARFTGSGKVHVVDPLIDLRFLFEETDVLRRSLEERQLKIDVSEVKDKYSEWWTKYKAWAGTVEGEALEAKKELRDVQDGLLMALGLPNSVHHVGKEEKQMLKQSKHSEYLVQQGLMRIDKEREIVHLVGYPVLIQNNLKSQLLEMFCEAALVSPSCFVRAAVLEGVNVPLEDYIPFTDGTTSFPLTFIVGHSLPSLSSLFIRAQFSEKTNQWPITVHSVGMAYHKKRNTVDLAYSRQRLKHCVLSMAPNSQKMDEFITDAASKIGALLDEGLFLDLKTRVVKGKELKNFESQAIVFEDKGLELARISRIGAYVSRRLNVTSESGFVKMAYVETDIDRILARLVDGLIDGRDIPKSLRDVVKQS